MPRFLPSPVFAFTKKLLVEFDNYVEDHNEKTTRILIHPISEGIRLRNLADDRGATIEISGALVTVRTYVRGAINSEIWMAEDEVPKICDDLITFFTPQE